ncbi:type II toxin-antitoxin system antitoxin SocA domain-containing protein [Aliarcobacter lanthieri]|uniref:type II toxin-antitoxin system antitoxin SocA domain-containing protein n=1 Tax=Aliarcobacter lanthieri TaxID=1355374 RepID=UPI0004B3E1AE|nr:type II toxin-antitoxin system antitoxin SocA domain-containing protein [Aliarcobacter lanthieri]
MIDMTKVANIILYMLHKQTKTLNNKKIELMLFFMENNHLNFCNEKIINETFIKDKRGVKSVVLSELFEIIINEDILDEEDDRVYFIQELMDFLDIEIFEKENFKELKFSKLDEDFDEGIFSKDELRTIHKIVTLYKDTSVRNLSNECFSIDKVRQTENQEVIL